MTTTICKLAQTCCFGVICISIIATICCAWHAPAYTAEADFSNNLFMIQSVHNISVMPGAPDAIASTAPAVASDARVQYAADMRRLFSPAGMVNHDGSINQEFFRPRRVITVHDQRWGDAERDKLYEGIQRFGIGRWNEIEAHLLPGWDHHNLRGKVQKLIGCQNLSWYQGKQLSKAQVQAEQAKNKALGESTGCWKQGMLVDNDQGVIKAHFMAAAAGGGGAPAAAAPAAAVDAEQAAAPLQGHAMGVHPAGDTQQQADQAIQ